MLCPSGNLPEEVHGLRQQQDFHGFDELSDLEQADCPLCGDDGGVVRYAWPNSHFKVKSCPNCSLLRLSPRLTEEAATSLYKNDHYFDSTSEHGYHGYELQAQSLRMTFAALFKKLAEQSLTGGRLLEVGCGYGYLLEEAAPFFTERWGCDFSKNAVQKARQVADKVIHGGLEQIPENESFDFIVSTHVLEHVYDPVGFLKDLTQHLKPNGRLLTAVPHAGNAWLKFLGRRWPSFKVPEHIWHFDTKSLFQIHQRATLQVVSTVPYPQAFPLSLVLRKLGIHKSAKKNEACLWIPGTTLAVVCKRSDLAKPQSLS